MAYDGGISYEIDQLKDLGVPELMRRQSVDPQLKYALALQEATKMVEAAARERDMSQQMPMPANVVGQMETSLSQRLAPGVQQQGQRSMQAQNRSAMGLPTQAAPNMQRMADGGIVGYAQGGMPKVGAKSKGPIPQMSPEENAQMLKYLEGLKKFDYYDKNPDKVSPEGRQALELERRMFEEQFPNAFKQKVNDMMYGPSKGMAMGGSVRGYASGGEIRAYLSSLGRDVADFTAEQLANIGQMLDSQVARGQNDTLQQVGRGAMGVLRDRMPATTSMSQAEMDSREADIESRRGGLGTLLTRDTSGPSVTEQLEAAQRRVDAEGRGPAPGRNVSPGGAAAQRRRELRDQMPDQEESPSLYERTKGYMPDFGAIAGMDMGEFAKGSGLVDAARAVDESGFFSGLEDALADIFTEVPEDSPAGYKAGVRTRDILSAPFDILGGFIQPTRGDWTTIGDIVEGAGEFGRGAMGMQPSAAETTETAEAAEAVTQPAKPLTEAEIFRRDAPASLVSAVDRNEETQAALRNVFPGVASTPQSRTAARAATARQSAPTSSRPGIAGLLQKAKPFADKAADIAEILGRGAGASKGFEFAKIAEESRRINQAEQARQDEMAQAKADRDMRKELLEAEYGFRDKELRSKLLADSLASERESDRELLESVMTNIDSDPEFLQAAEEFKDTYDVFFGSYDKDKYVEALAKKRQELIEKRFKDAKGQIATALGGSSTANAMDDLAKYGG